MLLTKGNIRNQMLTLCAPLILGNILQQFYNTIDAWIIGRYAGQLPFAAIGIAGTAMNLYLFFIVGLCTGISVVFAQLFGAGDSAKFRKEHFQTVIAGTVFSALLAAAGICSLNPLLHALGTPENLYPYAKGYLTVVLAGLPFSFLYNFYNALLRATGNVKTPLLILASAVGVNLFADLFFVKILNTGVEGAAAATVLSQMLSVAASIFYMIRRNRTLCFRRDDFGFSLPLLRRTCAISVVTGFHQASLYLGKMFVQSAVNSGGTDLITAYTATTRIEGFINSFGDSGAAATSVMVAQSYGAGDRGRIKAVFRTSASILAVFGALCSAILFVSAPYAMRFMLGTAEGPAFAEGVSYLRAISAFYLFCFLGNAFAGFFDGIGKTSIPFIGAASHITLRAILSFLWIGTYGLTAVAYASGIGWILANAFWLIASVLVLRRGAGLRPQRADARHAL